MRSYSSIINCYNYDNVLAMPYAGSNTTYAGGISGIVLNDANISYCIQKGGLVISISLSTTHAGGVAGISYGTITSCYWKNELDDTAVNGIYNSNVGCTVINSILDIYNQTFVDNFNNDQYYDAWKLKDNNLKLIWE